MKTENIINVEVSRDELLCIITDASRLIEGLNQCFIDAGDSLTDINPETGRPDAATDWIVENYETVAGGISLLSSLSNIFQRLAWDMAERGQNTPQN